MFIADISSVTTKNVTNKYCDIETLRYTFQGIHCCASYILLNRLGLRIKFGVFMPLIPVQDIFF